MVFPRNQCFEKAMKTMVETFTGPADKGIYSKSVQETLYMMACDALKAVDSIDNVSHFSCYLASFRMTFSIY